MNYVFEIQDNTERKVHLSKERWTHITSPMSPHAYMINHLAERKEVLIKPDKTINSIYGDKVNYYKDYKVRKENLKVMKDIRKTIGRAYKQKAKTDKNRNLKEFIKWKD